MRRKHERMGNDLKQKGPVLVLLGLGAVAVLSHCRKDEEEPYSEQILFAEPFDSWQNMSVSPTPVWATVDSSLIGVSNGKLELDYDPAVFEFESIGCEWERFDVTSPYREHIGIRVTLDSGYFQNFNQHVIDVGFRRRWTTMHLLFSDLDLLVPAYGAGQYEEQVVGADIFRIEGRELELIRDGNEFHLFVDGVEHPASEVNFHSLGYSHHWLHVWFEIGRTNESTPEIDHLGIDKFEIFTWTGVRPD